VDCAHSRDPLARNDENQFLNLFRPRGLPALTHWSFLCVHFHDLIQQRGTMSDISIPGGRIRSFVERIENLDTELQELNESKKEVFSEAKGEGFDVKILKEIIKLRKQDQDERDERDTLLDVYMKAMETARNRPPRPRDLIEVQASLKRCENRERAGLTGCNQRARE
jgi:uncharacterized protein (UPF0335 family)